jgi:hypothetical protein
MCLAVRGFLATSIAVAAFSAAAQVSYSWTDVTPPRASSAPLAPDGTHVATHPLEPRRLIASLAAGGQVELHASADAGRTWRLLSSTPGDLRRVGSLFALVGRPDVLFMEEAGGRLFRSDDFAETWSKVEQPSDAMTLSQFAPDPVNPDRVFAVRRTQSITTVAQSWDRGRTWTAAASGLPAGAGAAAVDGPKPAALARLFLAREGAIYVSRDSAIVWQPLNTPVGGSVEWVRQDPRRANVLYALRGADLVRSETSGASWRAIFTTGARDSPMLTIDPVRSWELWLSGLEAGLYRSVDGGDSWSLMGFAASSPGFARDVVPDVSEPGAAYVILNGRIQRGAPPVRAQPILIEFTYGLPYVNPHFWMAISEAEALSQDYRAEPGRIRRTGARIGVWRQKDDFPDLLGSCRFGPAPSTGKQDRVLTLQGYECESLKRDPAWVLEAEDEFFASPARTVPASPQPCLTGLAPVWSFARAFDLNHRYVVDPAISPNSAFPYGATEGISFCARPLGSGE